MGDPYLRKKRCMCTVLANAKSTYMHASLLFRETSVRRGRNIYWYRSVSQQYYKYRMQVSCCCQTHFMHVRMAFFHFYFPPRRNLERFTRPQFATKEPKEKKRYLNSGQVVTWLLENLKCSPYWCQIALEMRRRTLFYQF